MTRPQHRMVQVNGMQMHVAEQGTGPTVLLCHGFPETWYSWRHQLPAFAQAGFHAVAPDMRGYGSSGRPAETDRYTLLDLVGDMVGVLDAIGSEHAVIIGNDWGANVAWHAALLRPDRFRGVVALGVPMMDQPPMPPTKIFPQTDDQMFYALYFQSRGTAEREFEQDVRVTLRKLLICASGHARANDEHREIPNPFGMVSRQQGLLAGLPDVRDLPPWLSEKDLDVFADAFTTCGFSGGLNYYRNLDRNRELLLALRGLKVSIPALFIVGERDTGLSIPGMQQIIDDMPRLVPQLEGTVVLPECGHWLQQENPAAVTASIISFLRKL